MRADSAMLAQRLSACRSSAPKRIGCAGSAMPVSPGARRRRGRVEEHIARRDGSDRAALAAEEQAPALVHALVDARDDDVALIRQPDDGAVAEPVSAREVCWAQRAEALGGPALEP